MSDELYNSLRQLAITVKKIIGESISNRTIQPEKERYLCWKADNFQYTDKGITESRAHGEYITKPSWFRATIKLKDNIKKSNEYCAALAELNTVFNESKDISEYLERFVGEIIHKCLYDSKSEEEIYELMTTFLKDLREEPIKYGAKVELEGVVVQPDKVEPDFGVTLRQTKIEDIEKEFLANGFMMRPFPRNPSAILEIEFLGRNASQIQGRVGQAIAILRLFKVGSVKYLSYHMNSESIIDLMARGTLTSGDRLAALEKYLVTNEDAQKLKKFWQIITNHIPKSFFGIGETKSDHLTNAYNRYSDALLQNGILERRVANGIMGLEALFFKPDGEMQELGYRLRIRVSKLLGLLGYDPHEIKERVNEAYRIRSIFTHGGHLSYRQKKKLESKYKDAKNLLLSILDYLRIAIIVMMLIPKEKEEFIDLIDDSLIDRVKEDELTSVTSGVKEILR